MENEDIMCVHEPSGTPHDEIKNFVTNRAPYSPWPLELDPGTNSESGIPNNKIWDMWTLSRLQIEGLPN